MNNNNILNVNQIDVNSAKFSDNPIQMMTGDSVSDLPTCRDGINCEVLYEYNI
jgi:hypothetical protein